MRSRCVVQELVYERRAEGVGVDGQWMKKSFCFVWSPIGIVEQTGENPLRLGVLRQTVGALFLRSLIGKTVYDCFDEFCFRVLVHIMSYRLIMSSHGLEFKMKQDVSE